MPFVVSLQDGALELHHQSRKDVAPESVLQKYQLTGERTEERSESANDIKFCTL